MISPQRRRGRREKLFSGRGCKQAKRAVGGFSLLEVVVALGILLVGIVAILAYLPNVLRAQERAKLLTEAALLAQRKAEEIRRDDDRSHTLLNTIRNLTAPTAAMVCPDYPNLAYSFSGVSVLYGDEKPGDPRTYRGVARVIVELAPDSRPSGNVLYEVRFDE